MFSRFLQRHNQLIRRLGRRSSTQASMTQLSLNPTETKIRDLLVEYSEFYNSQHQSDPLVLRITGGWVRDKLLNIESHDIDIAINNLSGEDFATRLNEYISENKGESFKKSSIHTIKKNPDKSKHLETCTTKIFGLDIDFVNLRSEAYTEDSRVPTIKYGTAQEDAMRRDATLNALFYNLNEDKIEDFTGKGMDDLRSGILRTPLQPLQTFLDDPLRALRLIRFASRLNYVIEDGSLEAMRTDEVKNSLLHKISRERVGVEIEKTLGSQNPAYGLQLINYTGLTDSIFSCGGLKEVLVEMNSADTIQRIETASHDIETGIIDSTYIYPIFEKVILSLPKDSVIYKIFQEVLSNQEQKRALWLSIALFPYDSDIMVKSNPKRPHITTHIVEVLLREGLKSSKADMDKVGTLVKYRSTTQRTLEMLFENPEGMTRSELGLFLKQFGSFQDLNLLFNLFIDCLKPVEELTLNNYKPTPVMEYDTHTEQKLANFIEQRVQEYELFAQSVLRKGLDQVHQMRLIVDGKTLTKELKCKPGPWVGQINNEILVWQLDHPEGTKEECMLFIKEILPKYLG